jgi:hypothetical protein
MSQAWQKLDRFAVRRFVIGLAYILTGANAPQTAVAVDDRGWPRGSDDSRDLTCIVAWTMQTDGGTWRH